jgi:hypothetical protein
MRTSLAFVAAAAFPLAASATTLVNQPPVSGGGVSRWSQLWQDPGPLGNDLDGDSVCWEDFTLLAPASINRLEWWGNGACELGFQIEVWRQDPNTIAYQPLGLFYYGGNHSVIPEARFRTTAFTTAPGPGGLTHYMLDLASPVALPANDPSNPRWFIAVIGLTSLPYQTWNWAQNTSGSTRTFQFVRGGTSGGGSLFRSLPEGRAMLLGGIVPGCYANCDESITPPILNVSDFACFMNRFAAADPRANCDGSTTAPALNVSDFACFLNAFAAGCP